MIKKLLYCISINLIKIVKKLRESEDLIIITMWYKNQLYESVGQIFYFVGFSYNYFHRIEISEKDILTRHRVYNAQIN